MFLKSYHALSRNKKKAWLLARRLVPHSKRFYYEGCMNIPGQLWYEERKTLYESIREFSPDVVFEVGTWIGGGSTFFIAQALFDNGSGTLFTIEKDSSTYQSAINNYNHFLGHLVPYVNFFLGESTEVYRDILKKIGRVDALFLDGASDPRQTVREFKMFEPYLGYRSVLMVHDWEDEKMRLLRPIIEESTNWILEKKLVPPKSVGFAVFLHK